MEKSWGHACMDFFSLLWKLWGTSPLCVFSKEPPPPCGADFVPQKTSPVFLQLLSHGTGSCGWESKEALWVCEEEWLGSAELLWYERRDVAWEIGVAPSPRDMLAGQGEWGKRPPTAFASSISLTLQEGRAVEDTQRFRAAWGNEEGGSGQSATFALFTSRNGFVLI